MMDIKTFFTNNQQIIGIVVIVLIVLGVIYYVQMYSNKKVENMEVDMDLDMETMPLTAEEDDMVEEEQEMMVEPIPADDGEFSRVDSLKSNYYDCNDISPEELLPKSEMADDFESQFPVGSGDLTSKNFLTAGYNAGINTVSSSLRNANLQVRSDPYIEPASVGPFLNSTILPDMNRKSLEIGS